MHSLRLDLRRAQCTISRAQRAASCAPRALPLPPNKLPLTSCRFCTHLGSRVAAADCDWVCTLRSVGTRPTREPEE